MNRVHHMPTESDDYVTLMARSLELKRTDVAATATTNLTEMMERLEVHLTSVGGGMKPQNASHNIRRNVERVFDDLLDGDDYSPDRLRRLRNIDTPPNGLV